MALGKRGSLTSEREKNNKLLLYKATVTVYIYIVSIWKINGIIEESMWMDFEYKYVK